MLYLHYCPRTQDIKPFVGPEWLTTPIKTLWDDWRREICPVAPHEQELEWEKRFIKCKARFQDFLDKYGIKVAVFEGLSSYGTDATFKAPEINLCTPTSSSGTEESPSQSPQNVSLKSTDAQSLPTYTL